MIMLLYLFFSIKICFTYNILIESDNQLEVYFDSLLLNFWPFYNLNSSEINI